MASDEFTIIWERDTVKIVHRKENTGELNFFQYGAGIYLSEFLLGMLREIPFHHPVIILRLSP